MVRQGKNLFLLLKFAKICNKIPYCFEISRSKKKTFVFEENKNLSKHLFFWKVVLGQFINYGPIAKYLIFN
jgi:hypothetical protein